MLSIHINPSVMQSADTIKSVLEEKVCPVHDVHPNIDITGNEIEIACCCKYFYRYCIIEAEYMLSKINLRQFRVMEI